MTIAVLKDTSNAAQELEQIFRDHYQFVYRTALHSFSIAEIAKSLGTTQSTVAVSLFRSRARLKKLILAAQAFGEQS